MLEAIQGEQSNMMEHGVGEVQAQVPFLPVPPGEMIQPALLSTVRFVPHVV